MRYRYRQDKQFNFFESKLILAVIAVVALFLIFYSSEVFYKKYQISKEVSILDENISQLQEEQEKLNEAENNLTDESYIEREAKLKLNLKKAGEEVVVLVNNPYDNTADNETQATSTPTSTQEVKVVEPDSSDNIKKWIKAIFE
jgi:cell division protein FtsL